MILTNEAELSRIAIHRVGNRHEDEGVLLSNSELVINESILNLLSTYFLSPFKSPQYYNLHHETDIQLNEVYNYCTQIFQDPTVLHEQSISLARHLYENSNHSKIAAGEFYVAYIENCKFDGKACEAIGIFKSESKDTFLKIFPDNDEFVIDADNGININKLDKGCLIFNTDAEEGYVVSVVDTSSKSAAQFWKDKFLKVIERKDSYSNTQNIMSLCSDFIRHEMSDKFNIERPDQADLLNKTAAFIDDNDRFLLKEYTDKVLRNPEASNLFEGFKNEFEHARDLSIEDNFKLSPDAKKKAKSIMKSVIKLDKNFHVYVHGDRSKIESGEDENGMKFYKLYYHTES